MATYDPAQATVPQELIEENYRQFQSIQSSMMKE